MKKIKKIIPAMVEMLLALTITGLVYYQAVRTDYRSTLDNAANPGHLLQEEKMKADFNHEQKPHTKNLREA